MKLRNGVEVMVSPTGIIVWTDDWVTLIGDQLKGNLPELKRVDGGPSTYGHTSLVLNKYLQG